MGFHSLGGIYLALIWAGSEREEKAVKKISEPESRDINRKARYKKKKGERRKESKMGCMSAPSSAKEENIKYLHGKACDNQSTRGGDPRPGRPHP